MEKKENYVVQETTGGYRQMAMFSGTLAECREFVAERCNDPRKQIDIVAEDDYDCDYL